jgi:hypothetical protein
MRVVEHVLRKIRDDQHLAGQINDSDAVAELVKQYNSIALGNGAIQRTDLYVATGETYGSDFKRYITYLPASEQLRLLNHYLSHFPMSAQGDVKREDGEEDKEDEDEEEKDKKPTPYDAQVAKEERQRRFWLLKTVVYSTLALMFILVGAMVAIMVHNHSMPDNALIKTFMETAIELIKILFPPTSK